MAEYGADKPPVDEDIRHDDGEYNPAIEPQSAKAWLNLLQESEDAFADWNTHCDNIDRNYAHLGRLSELGRQKEYQMFWANAEVLKPSIYAKAPIPVVVPKFKDRRPVYQAASEMMERCCTVAFDLTRINDLMLLVRDDLSMNSRGVAWCRYESGGRDSEYDHEKVCIDFKGRRDFLHSISRNWREVTWVAAASYLTRSEARDRFRKYSGDAYQEAEYKVDKDSKEIGGADNRERAKFWEIWHKGSRRVVWVAEGVEDILDEDDAHLDLQGFFPCPKPAYGTVQRGSLVPVPDVLQYKDQLDEINLLTGRIHALSEAISCKGFYPAGGGEAAEAIETAIKINTPGIALVPISNFAAFGTNSGDPIVWLPIDKIAVTITALVALRKQVIDDIYQITGMADIMRGDTDPNETLGAQQLKTQYGSTRIRDKQQELARLARDLVEITSEIITEKFKPATMIEMSQTQLPTDAIKSRGLQMLQAQYMQLAQQAQMAAQQAQQAPQQQSAMPGQQDPNAQQGQQVQDQMMMLQSQLQTAQEKPTTDQVFRFLKDNRTKSFVLDIETDSTIMADEQAEKQARTEFLQVLSGALVQMGQMIQANPKSAKFCGAVLKFVVSPYRAGRELDGSIDEFIQDVEAKGSQPAGDDPTTAMGKVQLQIEQMKQTTAQQKNQQDMQIAQAKLQQDDKHKQMELMNQQQIARMKMSGDQQDGQIDMAVQGQKMQESREAHQAQLAANAQKMQIEQQKAALAQQQHVMKANDMQARQQERATAAQFKQERPI